MSLGIVSELFKHVSVQLKHLPVAFGYGGNNFARVGQIVPTCFFKYA